MLGADLFRTQQQQQQTQPQQQQHSFTKPHKFEIISILQIIALHNSISGRGFQRAAEELHVPQTGLSDARHPQERQEQSRSDELSKAEDEEARQHPGEGQPPRPDEGSAGGGGE